MRLLPHHLCRLVAVAFMALLLQACGSSDTFIVDGSVEGGAQRPVELTYYADGAVRRLATTAGSDGRFRLEGRSVQPALAFLTVGGGAPAATLVVADGEHTELTVEPRGLIDAPASWTAKGTSTNAALARFAADNAALLAAGDAAGINAAVAAYVTAHPSDVASAALLVTRYVARGHETQADSLMALLDASARRPGVVHNFMASMSSQLSSEAHENVKGMPLLGPTDSTYHYVPARYSTTLLAFVGTGRPMRDSIVPGLRDAASRWPEHRCKVIEFVAAPDSASWRSATASDSATWFQAWAPGTVAAPAVRKLSVTRTPFFIVADSTGRQLYRGSSLGLAREAVGRQLINH